MKKTRKRKRKIDFYFLERKRNRVSFESENVATDFFSAYFSLKSLCLHVLCRICGCLDFSNAVVFIIILSCAFSLSGQRQLRNLANESQPVDVDRPSFLSEFFYARGCLIFTWYASYSKIIYTARVYRILRSSSCSEKSRKIKTN